MNRLIETNDDERGFTVIAHYSDEEMEKRQTRHNVNAMSVSVSHDKLDKKYVLTAQEVRKSKGSTESFPMADSSNWNYLPIDGERMNRKKLKNIKEIIEANIEELTKLMVSGEYMDLAEKTIELTKDV